MRAFAIPSALGGLLTIWACLAPAGRENVETSPTAEIAADASALIPASLDGSAAPVVEGSPARKTYIDLQRDEVSAIAAQIDRVREESATVVNDLLVRRQANSSLTWRGRLAELKAAQSLTDRRFQEWQDCDQELEQAVERFERLSKSLPDEQAHTGDAASLIEKAALQCLSLSEGYREAGTRWSHAVQSECQLTKAGKHSPDESEPDIEVLSTTAKTATAIGQNAMRFAECGERRMDSYQDTVRFTRRMRSLKVVGPLHKVDSLSSANQKLYADVRQVANSLTKDPDISSERLAFLKNKLKTLESQIARNTQELNAASKGVRISYPCTSGSCPR